MSPPLSGQPWLEMLWTPVFLEIFCQTWISEQLGNSEMCTFLQEGEVKRGKARREERGLQGRDGSGRGRGTVGRGDQPGGPCGWTVTLGAGPYKGEGPGPEILQGGPQLWHAEAHQHGPEGHDPHPLLPRPAAHPEPGAPWAPSDSRVLLPNGTGPPGRLWPVRKWWAWTGRGPRPSRGPSGRRHPQSSPASPRQAQLSLLWIFLPPGGPSSMAHWGSATHVCVSRSCPTHHDPWTLSRQAPLSMGILQDSKNTGVKKKKTFIAMY